MVVDALNDGSKHIGNEEDSKDNVSASRARTAVLSLYRAGMHITTEQAVRDSFVAWGLDPPTETELDRSGHVGKDGGGMRV